MTDDLIDIVLRAQQAENKALTELVKIYQRPAQRVAQTILSNEVDAEDAVQDAWLLAMRRLDTLRQPEHFGAWFYRIVTNIALRKRQRRAAQPERLEAFESLMQPPIEQPTESKYPTLLPLAMTALSDKDQMVITLHHLSSVSIAQLAELLNVPQGTIKSRLHHARTVLRKELLSMSTQTPPTQTGTRPEHIPADFRQTIAGIHGQIEWQSIFSGDFSGWSVGKQPIPPGTIPAHWAVVGKNGLVGELAPNGTSLTYGDRQWRNVELSLLVTPLSGGNAQVLFRVDGDGKGFYLCDFLMGWQVVAVSRVTLDAQGKGTLTKLSVVNYPLSHQREYALTIAARDHSITTYIDGALVNQVTDSAWLHGQVGLNIWEAKTLFRDIRVRLLE